MNEERRRVLELLAQGTIDAEQADQLLAALEATDERAASQSHMRPLPAAGATRTRGIGRGENSSRPSDSIREASLHGVTPEYVRTMQRIGYGHLSLRDLTQLQIHGIDAEFVEEMGAHDYTVRELIDLRITGVTPQYVAEMRDLGFGTDGETPPDALHAEHAVHAGHHIEAGEER